MKHLLSLKTSVNAEHSITNQLVNVFEQQAKDNHEGLTITQRDLNANPIPLLNQELMAAIRAGEKRTQAQQDAINLSNQLINEIKAADAMVIGLPLYNFHAPATFKTYIDFIARAGISFSYTSEGPRGLLPNIPVYIIIASGGKYAGTEYDQLSGWLTQVLGFIGLTQVHFIYAEGVATNTQAALNTAKQQIHSLLAK